MIQIKRVNQRVIRLLNGLIQLKENILRDVGLCRLYTFNYPLLVEHILREAKLYREMVMELERRGFLSVKDQRETADHFARKYKELLEEARKQDLRCAEEMTKASKELTKEYQQFKTVGTKGLVGCEIRSVILPLLADHVLREANHYLRLLKMDKA